MQARPRPSVLSQEESRALWKDFRKASADGRSIIDILRDIGVIKPVVWSKDTLDDLRKYEPECCRAHLKILADMERITGDPERRKRFKFCPECGRRFP